MREDFFHLRERRRSILEDIRIAKRDKREIDAASLIQEESEIHREMALSIALLLKEGFDKRATAEDIIRISQLNSGGDAVDFLRESSLRIVFKNGKTEIMKAEDAGKRLDEIDLKATSEANSTKTQGDEKELMHKLREIQEERLRDLRKANDEVKAARRVAEEERSKKAYRTQDGRRVSYSQAEEERKRVDQRKRDGEISPSQANSMAPERIPEEEEKSQRERDAEAKRDEAALLLTAAGLLLASEALSGEIAPSKSPIKGGKELEHAL